MKWPDDSQCGVCLTFDMDAESVWIADDPENAHKPGVLSQGRYGPRVGLPLILNLLKKRELRATFFVPGVVGEEYSDAVRLIIVQGHEVGCHGYTHESPTELSRDREASDIERSLKILQQLGAEVVGYRSPAWEFSAYTLELLSEQGYIYSSNMMDDINPYIHSEHNIVELPVHWMLDDAPHFWFDLRSWNRKIASAGEVLNIWREEYEGIRNQSGLFVLTCHPQIIGRPGRLNMLDALLGRIQSDNVWIATCSEVSRYCLASRNA